MCENSAEVSEVAGPRRKSSHAVHNFSSSFKLQSGHAALSGRQGEVIVFTEAPMPCIYGLFSQANCV